MLRYSSGGEGLGQIPGKRRGGLVPDLQGAMCDVLLPGEGV